MMYEMYKQKGKLYIKTILNNFILPYSNCSKVSSVSNIGIQVQVTVVTLALMKK